MKLSRESRLLIDAARAGDDPSAADRKRVRAALARKIAVGAAAGAAAATATHAAAGGVAAGTSGAAGAGTVVAGAGVAGGATVAGGSVAAGALATGFGAKLLVTVAFVGAVGAGSVGYARHESAKASARAAAESHEVAAKSAPVVASKPRAALLSNLPPVVPAPAVLPVATIDAPAAPIVAAPPAKPLAPPVVPPTSASAPPSDLDAEIALLQDINGAVRDHDGARALRLLDEHRRRFPKGALDEESEAARVFALCEIGRGDEARDVAGRFLREHPRSPLAPRVSRACEPEGASR